MFRKNRISAAAAALACGMSVIPLERTCVGQISANGSQVTPVPPIPAGDYGDAPDGTSAHYPSPYQGVIGNFPTRHSTPNSRYGLTGGYTVTTTQERLGGLISVERGPRDRSDPDQVENFVDDDFDDGLSGGPCPNWLAYPYPALMPSTLYFEVEIAPGAPAGTRYINILLDRNLDGVWSSGGGNVEWIAVDQPVTIAPGSSGTVTIGPIPWPVAPVTGWMRVALTRAPITGTFPDNGTGWDGGGTFTHGEIEDYLTGDRAAGGLSYAADAASASDSASRFAAAAAFAYASANPPDQFDLAAVNLSAYVNAVAFAHAQATASASAVATASAEASASAMAAASAEALAIAHASAVAAACISCPCATLCASAGANASAAVMAATEARAAAEVAAAATVTAEAHATAQVTATAQAQVSMSLHVSAFAVALASAQAEAASYSVALAAAQSSASAAASAYSAAVAAVCGGDVQAAAAAAAQAGAYAQATAFAVADAQAYAQASAVAWADARITLQLMIRAQASAQSAYSAASFAASASSSFAMAAARAEASAVASASAMASAFATVSGACSGDCGPPCPPCTTTAPPRRRNGITSSTSVRTFTGVSTWTMTGVRVTTDTTVSGFRWQGVEASPSGFTGMGDFSMWPAPVVQGGGAHEGNAMMQGFDLPITRTPVTTECGQPLTMFGQPVYEYGVQLPSTMTLPAGADFYVAVRGVGSTSGYNSRILSAHREPQELAMPSYFMSSSIPSAVPVSTMLNCDHAFTVNMTSN